MVDNQPLRSEKRSSPDRVRPTASELGWLAGIVDGEGCFSAQFNKRRNGDPTFPHVSLQIASTDWFMMQRVKTLCWQLSGHRIVAKELPRRPKKGLGAEGYYRRTWLVSVARKNVLRPILEALLPHLVTKVKQARAALKVCSFNVRGRRMLNPVRDEVLRWAHWIKWCNNNPYQPDSSKPQRLEPSAPAGESTVRAAGNSG